MVSSSFSSSSKRARCLSNGGPIASCLVDGCVSDLSKCREYHRRHKVCEVHSKSAIVMVGGREQRFCQQCSREVTKQLPNGSREMAEACKEMGCLISNSAAEGDGELWVLIEGPSALVGQVHKLPRRVEPPIKNSKTPHSLHHKTNEFWTENCNRT